MSTLQGGGAGQWGQREDTERGVRSEEECEELASLDRIGRRQRRKPEIIHKKAFVLESLNLICKYDKMLTHHKLFCLFIIF